MTLWETGESNGKISLSQILEDETYEFDGAMSELSLEELFFAACRGGWPRSMALESVFFASTFWTKLQNIFGHCCMSILDKVAKPDQSMLRPAI